MNRIAQGERPVQAIGSSSVALFIGKTVGFALLLAIAAKIQVPVPGSPVPATLQTLGVILAGALLGPWGGAASVATYLAAGVAGAPVFAFGGGPAYLLGPTGGYLLGFLPAAWVAGLLARRSRGFWSLFAAFTLACFIIHLFGWAQLAAVNQSSPFAVGVLPFIALDLVKALLAAALIRRLGGRRTA